MYLFCPFYPHDSPKSINKTLSVVFKKAMTKKRPRHALWRKMCLCFKIPRMTTKEKILEMMGKGEFVSGELMAQECGISRAAVHKAIESLRNAGYFIDAVKNKGYMISHMPDDVSGEEIGRIAQSLGCTIPPVMAHDTIDSTNTEAKRLCAEAGSFRNADGSLSEGGKKLNRQLIVSGEQTAGRGRMGREFVSKANSGIYFSLIHSPKNGVTNPAMLTAAAAVAVSRALDEIYGTNCRIKWVNDILLEVGNGKFKKVCGILTEGIANFETGTVEAAIIGIGINVRKGEFPGALGEIAGSVEDILGDGAKKGVSRNEIVARTAANLLSLYDAMENNGSDAKKAMMESYKEKSMLIGRTVTVNPAAGMAGETYGAKVIGISDEAELVVEAENGGTKCLHSGEVSIRSSSFS